MSTEVYRAILSDSDTVYKLHVLKYSVLAAFTCLQLEFVATVQDEVGMVWPSRMSVMKVVFLVNRYSPFLDITLAVVVMLGGGSTYSCTRLFQILTYGYAAGAFFSEFVLIIRTVALWAFNRKIIVFLTIMILSLLVATLIKCHEFVLATTYPPQEIIDIIGCVPATDNELGWSLYVCIIISETIVVGLSLLKWFITIRHDGTRSILVQTMYRDGSIFYVILLAISVMNLIFMLVAPGAISSILQMPLRVVHSALCTRVLLNLRKAAADMSGVSLDEYTRHTTMAFDRPKYYISETTSDYPLSEISRDPY
ncbi:hypothetical protein C8Q80DRAFT_768160 [Daedaleopsis nitida]|nr:hypothetical protein C8Q80DRAFT_768160 [Daedaleopsis nitida]